MNTAKILTLCNELEDKINEIFNENRNIQYAERGVMVSELRAIIEECIEKESEQNATD